MKKEASEVSEVKEEQVVLHVEVETIREMLATSPNNKQVYSDFIAKSAPDAVSREEEIAAIGADEFEAKGKTVFPRDEYGLPIMWNYQVKGFLKEAWKATRQMPSCKASAAIKAGLKKIDLLVFVEPRQIILDYSDAEIVEISDLQRPLRAQTAQGERVALANSEMLAAGTKMSFDIILKDPSMEKAAIEWLEYGKVHGLGCWRNADHGSFVYEVKDDAGNVLCGNKQRYLEAKKAKDEARAKAAQAIRDKLNAMA